MTTTTNLAAITGPSAWRGDELASRKDWIYQLSDAERTELEQVGRQFLADDPDLRRWSRRLPADGLRARRGGVGRDMAPGEASSSCAACGCRSAPTRCRARCTSSWACTWACRCVRTSSVT